LAIWECKFRVRPENIPRTAVWASMGSPALLRIIPFEPRLSDFLSLRDLSRIPGSPKWFRQFGIPGKPGWRYFRENFTVLPDCLYGHSAAGVTDFSFEEPGKSLISAICLFCNFSDGFCPQPISVFLSLTFVLFFMLCENIRLLSGKFAILPTFLTPHI